VTDIDQRPPVPSLPEPAERLRLRELYGVTQTEVAKHIGVTRQAIYNWEHGLYEPTGDNRVKYAGLLATWQRTETSQKSR
jgi:DNA-binding XRE family transcriptional regulator